MTQECNLRSILRGGASGRIIERCMEPNSAPLARASDLPGDRDGVAVSSTPYRRIAGMLVLLVLAAAGAWYWLSGDRPREQDRVIHPAGYSIIKPRGWTEKVAVRPASDEVRDMITLDPENWIGLAPSMWVKRFASPPD